MLRFYVAAALGLASPLAHAQAEPAPAASAHAQPYQLVRTLQSLQNEAASGNRTAHAAQSKLLRDVEQAMLAQPPEVWDDPRNTRAAVQYVLSGGQPGVLAELLKRGEPAGLPKGLGEGALAYVMGDNGQARTLLMQLDPASLHESLAGHLALVQATLILRNDQKRALQLLDQARLASPGSLVEEGALRRAVFIAAEINDLDRLEKATAQYMRRFDRSVYAENFRQAFATGLVRFDIGRDPEKFPRLVTTLRAFDREQQRAVLLIIARDALVRGRFEQARRAADEVARIPGADQATITRASLYRAASRIGTDKADGALETLKKIDGQRLPPEEKEILQTALRVASHIIDVPAGTTQTPIATPEPADLDPRVKRIVTAAERSLAEAQTLLDGSNQGAGRRADGKQGNAKP
ncbi:MAG TPA: chemotaxis protein [Bosea sp. (in: a-proteobacteria)]|jgi:chemotaxis protein MotC|uniref:chemotaxis protein n=1 Tax=Bosea sp. (in: a-proteobacteria) TaxID=1871050 RepID=UPI002E0ECA86|nr:chemotaxis protein [Bosea sp. (in: a-proteobacteria)]